MIARACRVFPGVLVTMLLAGPMLAAPAMATTAPDSGDRASLGHAQGATHRGSGAARPHRAAAPKAGPKSAGRSAVARARAKAGPTAASVAFIDDGASYRETPGGGAVWTQSGAASWYGGSRWQGHRTSSGSIYNN